MREYCNIQHRHAGCRCIRSKGHRGLCWSAAEKDSQGAIGRCLWYSKDGEFKSHHSYEHTTPSTVTANGAPDAQG
jgi:hypothetical protein